MSGALQNDFLSQPFRWWICWILLTKRSMSALIPIWIRARTLFARVLPPCLNNYCCFCSIYLDKKEGGMERGKMSFQNQDQTEFVHFPLILVLLLIQNFSWEKLLILKIESGNQLKWFMWLNEHLVNLKLQSNFESNSFSCNAKII